MILRQIETLLTSRHCRAPIPDCKLAQRRLRHYCAWAFCLLLLLGNNSIAQAAETCSGRKPITSGDYTYSLEFEGRERSYRVHVPPGYSPTTPIPVVMAFHGGYGTGKYMQKQTRMTEVSDANRFLGVFPDGLHRTWNAGGCCEESMRKNINDVGFVGKMLDKLEADYCVDRRRVFATGFSNGSMFAHRLACELSDRVAAVAPVSGVIMVSNCQPKRPMSVMIFHGTADPRSLWEGGLGDKDPEKGVRDSLAVTVGKLTSRYHCATKPKVTLKKGAVTCETDESCDGSNEVTLCKIQGAGHQWPGGESIWTKKLGPMNTDISASELMWKFFQRHPMPGKSGETDTPASPNAKPSANAAESVKAATR